MLPEMKFRQKKIAELEFSDWTICLTLKAKKNRTNLLVKLYRTYGIESSILKGFSPLIVLVIGINNSIIQGEIYVQFY